MTASSSLTPSPAAPSAETHRLTVAWKFLTLVLALLLIGLVSLGLGSVRLSPKEVYQALVGGPKVERDRVTIVRNMRLPRILLAGMVGAGLGVAGAAFQGLFRNPLADPYVVGAANGAAVGGVLVLMAGWSVPALGVGPASAGAFVGAMGTAVLVYLIAAAGRMPPVALLLAGAAVSTMLGGVVWLVLALADQDLSRIVVWLMGGFSGRNPWLSLLSASGPLLLGLGMLWASSRMLDALCSGEESAQALGLRIGPAYAFIMVGASLTTAAAVAAGGVIGFVGLVAPHAARRMLGGANVRLIPASALCGAILLVAADGLARSVKPPFDLPVGVITALLGGPFFLVVLRRQVIKAVVGGN